MAFSVYAGATDISNHVVNCPPIPIIETTHENAMVLPAMSITVIDNAVVYALDDVITVKDGTAILAKFIIDDITTNIEEHTQTLSLVSVLALLDKMYVYDLVEDDYWAAIILPDDYTTGSPNYNLRYYTLTAGGAPYAMCFVALTHYIKTVLIKAGIVSGPTKVDLTDYYGELESGFIRWNTETGHEHDDPIYYDQLAFQTYQLKHIKRVTNTDVVYEGATCLEILLFVLQILDAEMRWVGDVLTFTPRTHGAAPADDDVYRYSSDTFVNTFDQYRTSVTYIESVGDAAGFTYYVTPILAAGQQPTITATSPADYDGDTRPRLRTNTLMRHCIVHAREMGTSPGYGTIEELHQDAYSDELTNKADYLFAAQYAALMAARFPATGVIERITTAYDPTILGTRKLLRLSHDIVNNTSLMEY